jgi:hypothetical protein
MVVRTGFGVLTVVLIPIVAVALLLWVLFFGTAAPAQAACSGATTGPIDAKTIPAGARVRGFGHDQLVNAAAIANAASTLGLDGAGQALGIQAAIGESSLVNIDYGDGAINPDGSVADSIGLFQQQRWWGPVTERMDPTMSATLFYRRLITVHGWEQLAPTVAINRVQGNADPYYYAQFGGQAAAILAYFRAVSSTGTAAAPSTSATAPADASPSDNSGAACVVSGDARQLAGNLVKQMKAGRLTLLEPRYGDEIRRMADGTASADCGLDPRVLQIITIALQQFHTVGVSDLNRKCTGSLLGAGTASAHWINGGGEAVDFYSLGGSALTGGDVNSMTFLHALAPLMPAGARAGQVECRTPIVLPNMTQFSDTCNHLHLDVAFADGKPLNLPAGS